MATAAATLFVSFERVLVFFVGFVGTRTAVAVATVVVVGKIEIVLVRTHVIEVVVFVRSGFGLGHGQSHRARLVVHPRAAAVRGCPRGFTRLPPVPAHIASVRLPPLPARACPLDGGAP